MDEIINQINKAQHLLLASHCNPDGDAVSSLLAMGLALGKLDKKVTIYNASPIPAVYRFLPSVERIVRHIKKVTTYDTALILDCGNMSRVGEAHTEVGQIPVIINIDHHVSNEAYGDINIIDIECVSTTQVVYNLFKTASWKISEKAAQSLYAGLVSDSLSFGTDRVTHDVFLMAADLVKLGAKPDECRDLLYEQNSLAKIRLTALMLKTLRLSHNAKVGSIFALHEMFEETGAKLADTEEALRLVMSMGIIDSVIMLREEKQGFVKASLRSKGMLDMNAVASHFGGGGHIKASGFNVQDTIKNVSEKILQIITKELE